MAYQDTFIRGRVTAQGDRSCASRYEVIRDVAARYRRPITVWDIGANMGYFGCRLAHDFDAVSIMVDSRPALIDVCRENDDPHTVALLHRCSAQDLAEVAASEHADLVLALNVLHHMPDWRASLASVLDLGERVIIETPGRGDTGSAHYEVSQRILDAVESVPNLELLTVSPSHVTPGCLRPMFMVHRPKAAVTSGYAYRERVRSRGAHSVRPHTIHSSLIEKTVTFRGERERPWVPGMNLWNWAQLGGAFPSHRRVRDAVRMTYDALERPHGDFRPWNLILSGQTVTAIDIGHRNSVDDRKGLRETLAWIDDPREAYAACA